jgi:opacity protein-like surface antigen
MFKKIALCAMLVLILAPAAVMAAGQQGQGQGMCNETGTCLNEQQRMAGDTAALEKFQNGQGRGVQSASQNGDTLMDQTRTRDQTCDQDRTMVRNMTRDQVRSGTGSGLAAESQGTGSNGDARMLQNRSCDQSCDQDQARLRNMTQDQVRQGSGSVPVDGSTGSVQNQVGVTKGNGQNFITSLTEQLGAQFRLAGRMMHASGQ